MQYHILRSGKVAKIVIFGIVVCAIAGVFVISQGKTVPKQYRQSRFLLDTLVEITVVSASKEDANQAISEAYEEMHRIETLLSRHQNESQISLVNQAAGTNQFTPVSPEVIEILQRSLQYSVMTDGLFDMTISPVIDLWGIGTQHQQIPDEAELNHLLPYVDYRNVEIQPEKGVRLRYPEVAVDLGGIAKGYSIDRGIEILRAHNITSALLNAGGDIRCLGTKPDGTPWRIGIKHPRESGILGVVELEDVSVATSGDYERYFIHQGTRYHHIFTPQDGMPARECQSVTILAQTAEAADVLATSVFLMGPEQGMAFIEGQPEVEGMIVRSDGAFINSSGFSLREK